MAQEISTQVSDNGDEIVKDWFASLTERAAVTDQVDFDEVLDLIAAAPDQGAYQVFKGERTYRGSLLKVSTLIFQEEASLKIEPGDRELIIIAAKEVKFDTEQIRVSVEASYPPSQNGREPAAWPRLPAAVRPKNEKHGPSGRDGAQGRTGEAGETPEGLTVIFLFGSISPRPDTIDTGAIDANFLFNGQNGGHGSVGGRGQDGQAGARGRAASFRGLKCRRGAGDGGDGGNGGRGGRGGEGGDGAPGAEIIFYGPEDVIDITQLFNISNIGGVGGDGGQAGRPGEGGKRGAAGAGRPTCGRGKAGKTGSDGARGAHGRNGENGEDGALRFIDDQNRPVGSLF